MEAQVRPKPEKASAGPMPSADRELVAAVLRKDRKATAEFVDRFADRVFRYLRSRLFPRPDRVDDLFQETFLAAWEHLPSFRGESPLEAWLLGIARHKIEDHFRACFREVDLEEQPEDLAADGGEEIALNAELDDAKLRGKVTEVLAQLPIPYATALVWRYWEKRSAREMAEMSGRTEKAVERLLSRARALFRARWKSE